ncbi:MAG: hypothetical protein HRU41_18155 [Saprospiraceae bacterium]|nr:hypothetical protein [Saprospiraceae bacterium]
MSFYKIIDGQRYDRKVLELAEELIQGRGDGRISRDDAARLFESVQDGRGITPTENKSLFYILDNYNFTDSAREWLSDLLSINAPIELPAMISTIIADEYDIQHISFAYSLEEITAQEELPHNQVSFIKALRLALETLFADDEDAESPRSIVMNVYELFPGEVDRADELIQSRLRTHLVDANLQLLPNVDWTDRDQDFDFNPPENGESASENWIFGLYMPTLSDHFYWIVVNRTGATSAYVYGFN